MVKSNRTAGKGKSAVVPEIYSLNPISFPSPDIEKGDIDSNIVLFEEWFKMGRTLFSMGASNLVSLRIARGQKCISILVSLRGASQAG